MKGAYLLYKCRLCGESFTEGHAPDGPTALLVAQGIVSMPGRWSGVTPGMLVYHECPADSGLGLADLIGAVPDGGDLP